MSTYLGASSLIGPDDVDPDLVGQRQGGLLRGLPLGPARRRRRRWSRPWTSAAPVAARSRSRCRTRSASSATAPSSSSWWSDKIDILFANEAEICSLYETDSWDEAADRVSGHCEIACLTRSEHGSVIVTSDGERVEVPAQMLRRVVDTTGAGDLYARASSTA